MKILFMGTPDFAVPSLQILLEDKYDIVGVVTQPDKPQGRKMVLTPPPVKNLALAACLPVFQPETLKDQAFLPTLQQLNPDLIVVVAYGKILPRYILDYPKYGCINVHGSLLPRWRGAAPIQWSILAGDRTTGVTTMQMDVGLDTGDMLMAYETDITPTETAGELFDRLSDAGARLLELTLQGLEAGTLTPVKQDESQACYAHMLDKKMAQIDWTKPAELVNCQIRGLNPWPIALTTLPDGARAKIFSAAVATEGQMREIVTALTQMQADDPQNTADTAISLLTTPATVLRADAKNGLFVACGGRVLRILELQVVGGKRMRAEDYLRGHTIAVGARLGLPSAES